MSYKIALYHLGSSLSKCIKFLKEIKRFLVSAERKFRDFYSHVGVIRDTLIKIREAKDFGKSKRSIIANARRCIADLTAIKRLSDGISEISREDEEIVLVEEKELVEDLKGDEEKQVKLINALLVDIFNELRALNGTARDIHKHIDPEIAAFGQFIKDAEELAPFFWEVSDKLKGQAAASAKTIQQMFIVFKYILGNAEGLTEEEKAELKYLRKIEGLNVDLRYAARRLGRELERVA